MSIPSELSNATATTRHNAREIHHAVHDLPEFSHSMAYSQGVKLFFNTLSTRAVQVIEAVGYNITDCKTVSNSSGELSISIMVEA